MCAIALPGAGIETARRSSTGWRKLNTGDTSRTRRTRPGWYDGEGPGGGSETSARSVTAERRRGTATLALRHHYTPWPVATAARTVLSRTPRVIASRPACSRVGRAVPASQAATRAAVSTSLRPSCSWVSPTTSRRSRRVGSRSHTISPHFAGHTLRGEAVTRATRGSTDLRRARHDAALEHANERPRGRWAGDTAGRPWQASANDVAAAPPRLYDRSGPAARGQRGRRGAGRRRFPF